MGDRGQVLIEDTGVVLYTHWGAESLEEDVARALERGRDRWDDPPYLTRVVFEEMVGEDDGITGYGIDTQETAGVVVDVTLNCREENVHIEDHLGYNDCSFEAFTQLLDAEVAD